MSWSVQDHLEALQVDSGEMPLDLRRDLLDVRYMLKLKSFGSKHPTSTVLHDCVEYFHDPWKNGMGPYGMRSQRTAFIHSVRDVAIDDPTVLPEKPPWLLELPSVYLDTKKLFSGSVSQISYVAPFKVT